ncbi:hypothetical protein BFJ66_g4584 [Fusarium oxysporum f. sp. cepae]|uniref:Protein kinase domain-containing protein n=1 Tax=Fusarium oxysporum f. sp. cepae TaxID=396571 RepID=A0A3L6NDX4_FUSOX|nr:hypothetical protein BFJ65_g9506 [Fusarium oxysporum f. sp. cepae]RKK54380.1 hypothetical protein BFJ66_g4584 [Fusarium oxysporum f. sp. cepae]
MQLPAIDIIYHEPITLSDGTVLSAMIWLPKNAKSHPVPAILEYLPYRKRDMTAVRDAMNHPYVAAHGYACVRADMRGTGDSQGILRGEYLPQEQDDALEILKWIAAQDWCTGSIGMIGISWGGFNGLQVAARRPPELKAVISICSTDMRYDDDIHYMGGCILTENLTWAASMFSINSSPPDPALVGDQWRDLWLKRLESGGLFAEEWHQHQRRDDFWKHASIGENYSSIQCPVYLVGGWMDPYTNTIFRMLENLKVPRKGLVGPWGHKYPNFGYPGPQIGFLQESIRWWDKWLKGSETGIMHEPMLRCYLQDPTPPAPYMEDRPGHWVAEDSWSDSKPSFLSFGLSSGQLTTGSSNSDEKLEICSPQTVGFAGGRWLIFGVEGEGPGDQRLEAGGSLLFDSKPLTEPLDFLGTPLLKLRIASNKANALIAATLSEVLPNGAATKVSHGVLNLTHRHGHEDVRPLEPRKFYDITLKLNHFGQRIGTGSRLRLALSSTYFPLVWPSPEITTLTIDCAHSTLDLPERGDNPQDSYLKPFKPAINGSLSQTELRPAKHRNYVTNDWDSGETALCVDWDDGMWEVNETGWRYGWWTGLKSSVKPDDPLSAEVEQRFVRDFERDDIVIKTKGWTKMKMTKTDMIITARLDAYENGKTVFGRDFSFTIPRDNACDSDDIEEAGALSDEILDAVVEAGRDEFDHLAPPSASGETLSQCLHTLLFPKEYYFSFRTLNGKAEVLRQDSGVKQDAVLVGQSGLPFHLNKDKDCNLPIYSTKDIHAVEDLRNAGFIAHVMVNGKKMCSKVGYSKGEDSAQRELDCLWKITTSPHAAAIQAPKILGLITTPENGKTIGFLEKYIPVSETWELSTLGSIEDVSAIDESRRKKWASQVRDNVDLLHKTRITWGDDKASNVLIHRETDDAWIIDFGGGWTEGWVDKPLSGTITGDEMTVKKIFGYLQVLY